MAGKFNLIFMYDSGKTVRWRLGPTVLRVVAALLLLLPLATAASLWANWALYQEREILLAEVDELQRKEAVHAQKSARLANFEQYLQRYEPSLFERLIAASALSGQVPGHVSGQASGQSPAHAPENPPPDVSVSGAGQPAPISGQAMGQTSGQTSGQTPPPGQQAASSDGALATGTASAQGGNGSAAQAGAPGGLSIFPGAALDKGLAQVEHLTVRRVGARGLRVSFDLYNTGQVAQLAGKTAFELVMPDGTAYPLQATGETSYRINRLKKITGNSVLPADVTDTEGAYLRVDILAGDDLIYRTLAPIQN